jgi:hypothetical protein
MTDRGEAELGEIPDHRCTIRDEVVEQSRKELVKDLRALGHKQMGVPALGDTLPILGRLREPVTLDDGHPLVCVGQHPGGQQPGHARTQDHRVVTELPHRAPLALWLVLQR